MSGEEPSDSVSTADVELVHSGYERWNAGDISGLLDIFSADIEYQNAPEWPGQRVYRGADTVTRFLKEEVVEVIALRPVEIISTRVVGAEVLVELTVRTKGAMSGLDLNDGPLFHLAKVRDGRISRVRVYMDGAQAVEAAGGG